MLRDLSVLPQGLSSHTLRLAFGTVVEVVPEEGAARVALGEYDDGAGRPLVTDGLPVLHRGTLGDRAWWLPDIGEHVSVLFDGDSGVILGSIYSEEDPPPERNAGVRSVTFADGTVVRHDRESGRLSVVATGDVEVTAGGRLFLGGEGGAVEVALGPAIVARIETLEARFTQHVLKPPTGPTPAHPDPSLPIYGPHPPALSDHTHTV